MITALVDPQKNLSEFWTAIGNKLRPSITVTITISMDATETPETAPVVITEHLRMGERIASGQEKMITETVEESFLVGGQVTDRAATPVEGATVTIVELRLTAVTDRQGRYILQVMKPSIVRICLSPEERTAVEVSSV